jgi:hypothetical protein
MTPTIQIDDLELANALDFKKAIELHDAVNAALAAMASHGSRVEDMEVFAKLLIVVLREKETAFAAHEREHKAGQASQSAGA